MLNMTAGEQTYNGFGLAKVKGEDGYSYLLSFKNEGDAEILKNATKFYGRGMSHVENVRFHGRICKNCDTKIDIKGEICDDCNMEKFEQEKIWV